MAAVVQQGILEMGGLGLEIYATKK